MENINKCAWCGDKIDADDDTYTDDCNELICFCCYDNAVMENHLERQSVRLR